MKTLTRIADPTTTLVTLTEVKEELGIEHNNDDNRLQRLLETTTAFLENQTGLCLVPQTWQQTQSCWGDPIVLDKLPVQDVVICYIDSWTEGFTPVSLCINPADESYVLNQTSHRCEIVSVFADGFPELKYDRPDNVSITITAGFTTPPPEMKEACMKLCGAWNELREDQVAGSYTSIDIGVDRLIRSMRKGVIC